MHAYTHTSTYTQIHRHIHTYMHACIQSTIYLYTFTLTRARAHTHTHTHTGRQDEGDNLLRQRDGQASLHRPARAFVRGKESEVN